MNKNNIILSIIIPAYNAEKYIGDLLSDLNSELQGDATVADRVEFIVVNDGSTDRTDEILTEHMKKMNGDSSAIIPGAGDIIKKMQGTGDNSLTYISQPNRGVSAARNAGLKVAAGEYVYFLDSDDKLSHGAITYYINMIKVRTHDKKLLNEKGPDVFSFGYVSEEGDKTVNYYWDKFDGELFDREAVNKLYLSKQICFHIGSTIFRKEFLDRTGLVFTEGVTIGEDVEFILKALSTLDELSYHSKVCFLYQIHENSAMQGYKSYSIRQFESLILNIDTIDGIMKNNGQATEKMVPYYNFFLANSYLSNLRYYLNSVTCDEKIDDGFLKYGYLLRKHIAIGNVKRMFLIKAAAVLSVKALLNSHRKKLQ